MTAPVNRYLTTSQDRSPRESGPELHSGVPEWEFANLDPDPDAPPMAEQIAAISAQYEPLTTTRTSPQLSQWGQMNWAKGVITRLEAQRKHLIAALENIAGSECIMVPDECAPEDMCPSCEAGHALDTLNAGVDAVFDVRPENGEVGAQ